MKKMFAVFAVLVVTAMIVVACGGSSGGGGTPAAAAPTTAAQATTTTASAMGAVSSGIGGVTSGAMGLSSGLTSGYGYAKRLAYVNKVQARAAGSSNTNHAKMVAKAKKVMAAPMVKKAVAKARAMKATVNDTFACGSGNVTIKGTDNSGDAAATSWTYSVTITFNKCQDTDGVNYWEEMNGAITLSGSEPLDWNVVPGSANSTETISNLEFKDYSNNKGFTGTPGSAMKLNITFTFNESWTGTSAVGSWTGSNNANGTMTATMSDPSYGTITLTETFSNLSDSFTGKWNESTTPITEEWTDTLNGSASISASAQGQSFTWTMAFSNLVTKSKSSYDANYVWQKDEVWVDGTYSNSSNPAPSTDCINGAYVFDTKDLAPLTWNATQSSFCPDSGEVKINTVTVTFTGNGAGTIKYGTTTTPFTNCSIEANASMCDSMM